MSYTGTINEPRHEKTGFYAYAKTKKQISFAVTAKLISAFVFATQIVQFLYYLNPKFQASSHLLRLYSSVCVGPGRKPRRPIFSQRGSNSNILNRLCNTFHFYMRSKTGIYRGIHYFSYIAPNVDGEYAIELTASLETF